MQTKKVKIGLNAAGGERAGQGRRKTVRDPRPTLPIQYRKIMRRDPVEAIEERLHHIQKALSILPKSEADTIFMDIVSKRPEEVMQISQPYINKSYSYKLMDSRNLQNTPEIPSLRIPFGINSNSSVRGGKLNNLRKNSIRGGKDKSSRQSIPGSQPVNRVSKQANFSIRNNHSVTKQASEKSENGNGEQNEDPNENEDYATAEQRFKLYIDNFCDLNERMYELNKKGNFKPQKIKERLPVTISAQTQKKMIESERRHILRSLNHPAATQVDIDFHKIFDADLYDDNFNKTKSGSIFKRTVETPVSTTLNKTPRATLHNDDYLYDKNYNYYVQLNTNLNRNFKLEKDKYRQGVFLGRTPQAGEELYRIKKALKPFYTSLPMSNLDIVRDFYRVYKQMGSKLNHKHRNSLEPNNNLENSDKNVIAVGLGNDSTLNYNKTNNN